MIFLNQLRGVSARVVMPKTGAWTADVDVDLDTIPIVPSGPAVLTVGTSALRGTIDDRASGRFGAKGHVRLVAGSAGWDTLLPPLHLHNDAGVLSTAVYASTAASVAETVVELGPPKLLGVDFARMKGPASNVFAGVEWWVDLVGITFVGPRPPLPPPPTIDILTWDPKSKVAEIASDILLVPGMTIADPIRFDGIATIEDVEHTFDEGGARAIAWCSTPSVAGAAREILEAPPSGAGTKLVRALSDMARQSAGVATLKKYPYRVVLQGPDGRLNLQATKLTGECPLFLTMIDVWAGVPGVSVKLVPASIVLVSFIDGDPARPVITGFDPDAPPPLEVKLGAVKVVAGELGRAPALLATPAMIAWIAAVTTYVNTQTGSAVLPPDAVSLILSAD